MNTKAIIVVVGFLAWSALCGTYYVRNMKQRSFEEPQTASVPSSDSVALKRYYALVDSLKAAKVDSVVQELDHRTVLYLPKPVTFRDDTTITGYLTRLAKKVQVSKDTIVTVVGHTDDVGQEDKNLALSYLRAKEVLDYLVFKGAPLAKVRFIGKGEKEPIVADTTLEARNRNRRVEILISK
ncbi:MAG TPA: OmpA family protein [Cytophagales bacterium]|nr:OmpA family protein [Cytophagales bacterium]